MLTMMALLRADIKQEIKDTLFGHQRQGAREKYAISQATIIDAYNKAFQFLSVNHGTQARKDFEAMSDRLREIQNNNDATAANLNKRIAYLESLLTQNNVQFQDVMQSFAEIKAELKAARKQNTDKQPFNKTD
jgi:hypothetical protein